MTINKQQIDNLRALKKNKAKFDKELETLRHTLFNELCLKNNKQDCDIAYCFFWATEQCEYPTQWKKILQEIEKE